MVFIHFLYCPNIDCFDVTHWKLNSLNTSQWVDGFVFVLSVFLYFLLPSFLLSFFRSFFCPFFSFLFFSFLFLFFFSFLFSFLLSLSFLCLWLCLPQVEVLNKKRSCVLRNQVNRKLNV